MYNKNKRHVTTVGLQFADPQLAEHVQQKQKRQITSVCLQSADPQFAGDVMRLWTAKTIEVTQSKLMLKFVLNPTGKIYKQY